MRSRAADCTFFEAGAEILRKNTMGGPRVYCAAEMKRCQRRQPLFLVALVRRGRSHIRVIPGSPTLVRRHVAVPSITIVIGRCAYSGERPLLAQSSAAYRQ